ncbi:unnamed protein product [Camellia sinensis]
MVNNKGKGTVSSSNLSPKHDDAADNSQSETTVSSPMKLNVKETGVVSESEDKEENTGKGVMNEENAMVVMKNGEIAIEEERNEETAMEEEEKHEDNAMEEDEKNEPNALEEEDDYEEENATEEEDQAGEEEEKEEEKEEENEEKAIEPAKTEEKIGADSKDKEKRSRKRGRKKQVAQRGSEKVAAKLEDKPGSSSQKKVSKRVESMGMIFMCSSKTKQDCYSYKVLGLPATKRDVVKKVYKGMRLFLFDFDLRLMYGIYKAAGPGGYNIEPKAFKSAFPSQVRFTVLDDCLPLAEEKFRKVIKDNYYSKTKFDCQLNSEQVKNLCKLFVAASRGSNSKKSGKHLRSETRSFVDRDRIRRRSRDEERRADRDRIRRRSRDEEKRADRDRIRRRSWDEERLSDRRYLDHPIVYERETYASTLAPLPRLQPLHAPPPRPTYDSYGRALEMDVYRREPFVERRDHRYLDLDLDVQYQDEIESRDPYIAYREPPPYRDPDPLYSAAGLPPEYNPPGLRAEYRYPVAPPPSDYGPPRLLYRY